MFLSFLARLRRYLSLILAGGNAFLLGLASLAPFFAPESAISIFIALLGLAFPYFYLANLVAILWSWRRRQRVILLISSALAVLGLANIGGYIQLRWSSPEGGSLRLMSYNVHYFDYLHRQRGLARDKNMLVVLDEIAQATPDIVCLQEFSAANAALSQQAHLFMLEKLKYSHFYKGGRSSLAIYARFPLSNGQTINFEGSHNGAIAVDALVEGRHVRIFNLHLQSIKLGSDAEHILESQDLDRQKAAATKQKYARVGSKLRQAFRLRQEQAETMAAHIKNSPHPVILAGDLNDTPISYTYRQLSRYLYDSYREAGTGFGSTYAGAIPWLRIDYALIDPKFYIHWHSVRQRASHSDHYPILVGLSWRK